MKIDSGRIWWKGYEVVSLKLENDALEHWFLGEGIDNFVQPESSDEDTQSHVKHQEKLLQQA